MNIKKGTRDKRIVDAFDRVNGDHVIIQFILHALFYALVSRMVIHPHLLLYGDFTVAETYEYRMNGHHDHFIRYSYYVDGVEYRGYMGGSEEIVEICYWPKYPWIHYEGQFIRKIRNRTKFPIRTNDGKNT